MKLYSFPGAPSPLRVDLMIKFKGLEIETETVDIRGGAQLQDPFRSINPRCTVPTLVTDDGTVLTEVIAICLYLDEAFPEKPLCGRNSLERAQVINWMHKIFTDGFLAAAEALRNSSPQMKDRALPGPLNLAQIPELAERGLLRLGIFMRSLDKHLQGREFMVGDSLTQADIDASVVTNFAGWVKIGIPEECTALKDWKQRAEALLG